MTNQTNRSEIAKCLMADAGSVMMEYVVLLVCIVVGVTGLYQKYEKLGVISQDVYDYAESSFGSQSSSATLGSQIVHFYQQLQGGLSLPVP